MSQGSSQIAQYSVQRISAGISSGVIIDPNEAKDGSIPSRLKNYFKTRTVLNQTQSIFIDFKRTKFPEVARDRYFDVCQAYKRQDRVDLMKYLSVPIYDIFKYSLKENRPLPFNLYTEFINIELVQGKGLHKIISRKLIQFLSTFFHSDAQIQKHPFLNFLNEARIYSESQHATNASKTWHQLTCKFIVRDTELQKDFVKYNVFERREVDSSQSQWRICHLQ